MNKKIVVLVCILLALFAAACKTVPKENPDFLGDYPERELAVIMLNTIAQGKNELFPRELRFVFHPAVNMVEVNFKYGVNNITLALTEANRAVMLEAMNRYLAEYKAGALNSSNNMHKGYFGSTPTLMMWGVMAAAYYAKPEMRFEYQLITEDRPYFVIGNQSAVQTYASGNPVRGGINSPAVRVAFSPLQCAEVLKFLNQEYLLNLVKEMEAEAAQFDIPEDAEPAADPAAEKPLF